MQIVSIRMPEELWDACQEEAMRTHISASEFARMAILTAVVYRRGRRGHEWGEILDRLGMLEDTP